MSKPDSSPPAYLHRVPSLKGVYAIALNRPAARNAISRAMLKELSACLHQAMRDPTLAVLLIHSSSPHAFCAGADLVERQSMSKDDVIQFLDDLRLVLAILEGGRDHSNRDTGLSVPTICAIDGPALGGGLEMALACDFRVCAPHVTKLGFPETRLGIIPGAGGTQRAPRVVGLARAKELIFTGRTVDAVEAKEIGLIDYLADPGCTAYERALKLAESMADSAPLALRAAKVALSHAVLHPNPCSFSSSSSSSSSPAYSDSEDRSESETSSLSSPMLPAFHGLAPQYDGFRSVADSGLDCERRCYEQLLGTRDRLEALDAWREGRRPVWRGE